jgi:cystathionine beta-lyase
MHIVVYRAASFVLYAKSSTRRSVAKNIATFSPPRRKCVQQAVNLCSKRRHRGSAPPQREVEVMKHETQLIHAGRHPERFLGAVNPPVYRTSTVLSRDLADWEEKHRQQASDDEPDLFYGRHGTPTSRALQEAVAVLEGGYKGFVYPSGVSACATAILSCVGAGDHLLVPDSVYGPVRRISGTLLKRFGVEVQFYDPTLGGAVESLFRSTTRAVYVEAPGSLTFEMQDIPAIAAAAHRHGAVVIMDNTWATPLYFKPFEKGVDISVHAATKYIVGHSDAMLGVVTANKASYQQLKNTTLDLGQIAGPEECYLGQRGIRTLHVRLERHWKNGLALAEWLKSRPEVATVMHPALPSDPGHALWKRDFQGASGLFSFVVDEKFAGRDAAFIDTLTLFGLGGSWGGFESLVMPVSPPRTVVPWPHKGPCFRLHAGLENVEDLIEDLDHAFAAIR